jgi:hypothetical protein
VYYKVILFWITDYDATNPAVSTYSSPNTEYMFDSTQNYQKIVEEGQETITGTASTTIPHSLLFQPNFRVFFEALSGEVWPLNFGGVQNPFLHDLTNQAEMTAYSTTTDLNLSQTLPGAASVQDRKVWYRLYADES